MLRNQRVISMATHVTNMCPPANKHALIEMILKGVKNYDHQVLSVVIHGNPIKFLYSISNLIL